MKKTPTIGPEKKRGAVTMADVAREVGVSKMTVSFALNGKGSVSKEMHQTVLAAAQRLGYEPNPHAQNLSNGRSNNTVGLFSLWLDFGVGSHKVQLIQSELNQRGFDVPIYGVGLQNSYVEEAQVAAIASIRRQRPRALVCFTARLHLKALLELQRYQEEGGILVSYDSLVDLDCDTVIFDREDNTYQSAAHLLKLGHRKIGYGAHNYIPHDDERTRGFQRAIKEFGGESHASWFLEGRDPRNAALGGRTLAAEFLSLSERPSAVCIVNDYSAIVFIAELQRAGVRCPQDVSVVGHDDYEISQFSSLPLTTVSHPSEAIAENVVKFLTSRLDAEYGGPSRQITVRGELIQRESAISPSQGQS